MNSEMPRCPICGEPLSIRLARGRKSGKPFAMLLCARDGRHFRGFINHRAFVEDLLNNFEAAQSAKAGDR
jgi:hypothetical protein